MTDNRSHMVPDIRPLSPSLEQDFLAFISGDGFVDNPKWASCYCQYLYVDHRKVVWMTRSADENRQQACERIAYGQMQGYLAYLDGKVIGWCNAAPRSMMDAFADEPEADADKIGQIGCFVVAPEYRRAGVATALLAAACDGFRAAGLTVAYACPVTGAGSDAKNHFGPLAMYLAAGFEVLRQVEDGQVVVRRSLVANDMLANGLVAD